MERSVDNTASATFPRRLALGLAVVLVLLTCTGCDPLSFFAGFNSGFLAGRLSVGAVEVRTVERTCWQNGVQVPCP